MHLDIDSKVKQVYRAGKQGAEYGYTKVRGLHFQIVTASTPLSAPVIVATRLCKGSAGSTKGASVSCDLHTLPHLPDPSQPKGRQPLKRRLGPLP
ncbi:MULTISPECIES: hypothetical protein [Streptacidiphilus]|uniref:Transposase DDE domain-containing protein n=1 Tax=Streptacidiphilus cavernicola TaxID=3342716 RepID=A0ABV6UHL3_9ACTN|nr:hypothetical protein [Streptacidiphilus jeojiense]